IQINATDEFEIRGWWRGSDAGTGERIEDVAVDDAGRGVPLNRIGAAAAGRRRQHSIRIEARKRGHRGIRRREVFSNLYREIALGLGVPQCLEKFFSLRAEEGATRIGDGKLRKIDGCLRGLFDWVLRPCQHEPRAEYEQ